MKKTVIIMIIITVLSKVFGFGREIALAYKYGASNISDAYLIALLIPTIIFTFVGNSIATAYIPIYTKIQKKDGDEKAREFTSNLINVLLIVSTILIVLGFAFSDKIVWAFASGFDKDTLEVAVTFTRVTLFGIYFLSLVAIFSGYLQMKGNFIIPTYVGIPMNLCLIITILLSSENNTELLSIGIILGIIMQFILLLPYIRATKFKHKMKINIFDKNIVKMINLAIPVIIGVAVNDINAIVDRTLASRLITGGISSLNYAKTFNDFVQGIVVITIANAIYPIMTRQIMDKKYNEFRNTLAGGIIGSNLLVFPFTVGIIILSNPLVDLLFGRGAFDSQDVNLTASVLVFYAIGMPFISLRQILSRAFYSIHDTKTPMVNASIGLILNIPLNIIFSIFLGIKGLALATSISAFVIAALLARSFYKKMGISQLDSLIWNNLKILVSSSIMGVIVYFSYRNLYDVIGKDFSLILTVIIGIVSYFLVIFFAKVKGVNETILVGKNKIKGILSIFAK